MDSKGEEDDSTSPSCRQSEALPPQDAATEGGAAVAGAATAATEASSELPPPPAVSDDLIMGGLHLPGFPQPATAPTPAQTILGFDQSPSPPHNDAPSSPSAKAKALASLGSGEPRQNQQQVHHAMADRVEGTISQYDGDLIGALLSLLTPPHQTVPTFELPTTTTTTTASATTEAEDRCRVQESSSSAQQQFQGEDDEDEVVRHAGDESQLHSRLSKPFRREMLDGVLAPLHEEGEAISSLPPGLMMPIEGVTPDPRGESGIANNGSNNIDGSWPFASETASSLLAKLLAQCSAQQQDSGGSGGAVIEAPPAASIGASITDSSSAHACLLSGSSTRSSGPRSAGGDSSSRARNTSSMDQSLDANARTPTSVDTGDSSFQEHAGIATAPSASTQRLPLFAASSSPNAASSACCTPVISRFPSLTLSSALAAAAAAAAAGGGSAPSSSSLPPVLPLESTSSSSTTRASCRGRSARHPLAAPLPAIPFVGGGGGRSGGGGSSSGSTATGPESGSNRETWGSPVLRGSGSSKLTKSEDASSVVMLSRHQSPTSILMQRGSSLHMQQHAATSLPLIAPRDGSTTIIGENGLDEGENNTGVYDNNAEGGGGDRDAICDGGMLNVERIADLLFHPNGSLNLDFFKVYPCKHESHVHDRKNCPFYHSQRDRRRFPVTYKAEQCEDHFDLEGGFSCMCPKGDTCDKCHNRHELLYHPYIYKQRFCSSYNYLECHRGRFCAFAHTRREIRCELFAEEEERNPRSEFFMRQFKTLWCPYGVQHDWHGCLYAHTYQDCRRSPAICYGSEPCPYWQKDLHSADYQKRCPLGPRCPYSHGSKEQLYHPAYYKTMPCADFKTKRSCPRGALCAFYHEVVEKRVMSSSSAFAGTQGGASGGGANDLVTNHEGGPAGGCSPCNSLPNGAGSSSVISGNASTTSSTISAHSHHPHQQQPRIFDYTRPIPLHLMKCLQPNFMRPPLFNLDDFEAFGHASRVASSRQQQQQHEASPFRLSGDATARTAHAPPSIAASSSPHPTTPSASSSLFMMQQQQHQLSRNSHLPPHPQTPFVGEHTPFHHHNNRATHDSLLDDPRRTTSVWNTTPLSSTHHQQQHYPSFRREYLGWGGQQQTGARLHNQHSASSSLNYYSPTDSSQSGGATTTGFARRNALGAHATPALDLTPDYPDGGSHPTLYNNTAASILSDLGAAAAAAQRQHPETSFSPLHCRMSLSSKEGNNGQSRNFEDGSSFCQGGSTSRVRGGDRGAPLSRLFSGASDLVPAPPPASAATQQLHSRVQEQRARLHAFNNQQTPVHGGGSQGSYRRANNNNGGGGGVGFSSRESSLGDFTPQRLSPAAEEGRHTYHHSRSNFADDGYNHGNYHDKNNSASAAAASARDNRMLSFLNGIKACETNNNRGSGGKPFLSSFPVDASAATTTTRDHHSLST